MPTEPDGAGGPVPRPWLKCDCADTPPTMPTCRDKHLPSCPMAFYDYIVRLEQRSEEAREKSPEPRSYHRRKLPDVQRAIHASATLTLRHVRAFLEGQLDV